MRQNIEGDNLSAARIRKPAKLTKGRLIFLGALTGSASAFFASAVIFTPIGLAFPPAYLLFMMVLGAFLGTIVTIVAGKHERLRWIALVVAAFIGLLIPVCLIEVLFILAGPD
jgi:hypothetical protein